jgi:hypothetical protein
VLVKRVLADVATHAIVRVNGSWGVVCQGHPPRDGYRVVDFWDVGRQQVRSWTVVEVQA